MSVNQEYVVAVGGVRSTVRGTWDGLTPGQEKRWLQVFGLRHMEMMIAEECD